ncbi:type I polyketide synthase [Streptomyces sp. NPDC014344]|uniref:type I polyketide synthase n=1 Tax=Streptomyces sp. NPDC014344 TaxID=3364871 RepID=UPI0036FCE885
MSNEAKLRDYLKKVTGDLRQAHRSLRELEQRDREPIAVVSMACRYPGGVASPEDLWELVASGRDAVSAFPTDRGWDDDLYDPSGERPGSSYTREGGFLHEATRFDAELFGISPREALAMDPQQRLVLETSWELLERAGLDPRSLKGSRTGVYTGVMYHDYASRLDGVPEGLEGFIANGSAGSIVSGRVAYTFGLEGPAVTVDTACSSSLVALHWAIRSLHQGECELAVAGGVTVMSTPHTFVEFSRQRGLAADGRCKSFGAGADGTGWGEGVGLLLLEKLSDARRNGHQVLAVLRGSAVNQDGASNGLTAPNGPAQQRVIREALHSAGLTLSDVDAVEAHGTGTKLGDPIEAQALLATYGQDRDPDRPLWLGSVKSNIGHTQAAAGVAGIIKMVEAMHHDRLPGTLHAADPTPHVDWSAGAVELLREERPWPRSEERPRRAGVSSFGISGTNAHVIVEEPPAPQETAAPQEASAAPAARRENGGTPIAWSVSARSAEALGAQLARLRSHAASHPELSPWDIGHALATTRATLEHRSVVVGSSREELLAGLEEAAGHPGAAVSGGRLALLFTGQGAQRVGMGRELYAAYPVFAEAFDAVCARVDGGLGRSLKTLVFDGEGEGAGGVGLLDRTRFTQAALFAVEVALFRLLESWGVRPDALLGHSVGEVVAAHVAGVLGLDDACALVVARGRLMDALPAGGAMVAVEASEDEVRAALVDGVSLAAVNGPRAVVVSGAEAAVEQVAAVLAERGARVKKLTVSHAFHSVLMDPMLEEFRQVAKTLTYGPARIPVVSNLTGEVAGPELSTPDYWVRHVREAVRFADGVRTLHAQGVTRFLEVGPEGVLTAMARTTLPEAEDALLVPALRKDRAETTALAASLARLHTHGGRVDWAAFLTGDGSAAPARPVALPTYAFRHRRYWYDGDPRPAQAADEGERLFWESVEREDAEALARTLDLPGARLDEVLPALAAWRRGRREQALLDRWRHRVSWAPAQDRRAPALPGTWLLVTPADGDGEADGTRETVAALTARGARALTLDEVEEWASSAEEDREPVDGLLSLLPDAAATLRLLQALEGREGAAPASGARLWSLTRGAVATGPDDLPPRPERAEIWGLGRVAALEHPHRWGGCVDLLRTPAAVDWERLCALVADGSEDQVALRAPGILTRRLVPAPTSGGGGEPELRGTVLVTGGTGALGARVARWAAERGAERLILTSRRGPEAPGAAELHAELVTLGAAPLIVACDVADREALAALLRDHPVDAVLHAAGTAPSASLAELDPEDLAEAGRAKVLGARNLHDLTAHRPLDAFVLFSSISGVWGSGGLGAYATANSHLDALAELRRAQGLTATSIAWGPWDESGMAAGDAAEGLRRRGLRPLAPARAVRALGQALREDDGCVTVADVDWDRFLPAFTAVRPAPLFDGVPAAREAAARTAAEDGGDRSAPVAGTAAGLRAELASLSHADGRALLLDLVRGHTAEVLGHGTGDLVDSGRPFRDLGFDSLTAVELRSALARSTGLSLPATLAFDHPTPADLVGFLHAELSPDSGSQGAPTVTPPGAGAAAGDPVAVVGIGCRFPGGAESPAELWRVLAGGVDAVGPFPDDRGWDIDSLYDPDPDRPGTSYVTVGGFLAGAGEFDAEFFGISPREALAMDPQQRLLLETSWEALERAGIDPAGLRSSLTGVFAGTNGQDYASVIQRAADERTDGYLGTASAASVVSGRVAYSLGLEGPAVTVDTACSSSLVAIHLAAQSLRQGECDLALAGGVTVMSTPTAFTEFSRQRGLATDGRCKPFAAGADGTGWGEGAGMLVLERLSDAERNGHQVLAVIRGSAVNQDGASNGLTAPNGPSQQRVIRQALANAGLAPSDVDAVEAHGTGTKLGDPIEAQALLATYGQGRDPDRPLWLGSVKSNIGHTQAAAGVAGVIKMILALRNGVLPRSLHADEPTGHVDWSAGAVRLATEPVPWPPRATPRRAGVSSFGFSGTNAHLLLEEPPAPEPAPVPAEETGAAAAAQGAAVPWLLSARSPQALAEQAARLSSYVRERPELRPVDVGLSLATTRTAFAHRLTVVGSSREDLLAGLEEAAGHPGAAVSGGRLALLFTGQGAQRVGMGRELYAAYPVFADAFDAVCARVDGGLGRSLKTLVFEGEGVGLLDRTRFTQAALFAVEVALFRLLESWGVRPDALLGHSVGEIVAAHVAGVLDLDDACALVVARGRLMDALPAGGAMVAVEASEDEVRAALVDGVSLAAVNGPRAVVVSGAEAAVEQVAAALAERGARTKRLTVSHAFHSVLMDPMLEEFRQVAESLTYGPARIPVVSNLTGEVAGPELSTAGYWVRHVREAVRFADGIRTLHAQGVTRFLELGPDGVLTAMAQSTLPEAGEALFAPVLRKDREETFSLLTALGRLHAHGGEVDWAAHFTSTAADARRVELPTYAFQRERYWLEPADGRGGGERRRYGLVWRPRTAVDGQAALPGRWLIAVPDGAAAPWAGEAVKTLAARADEAVVVRVTADASRAELAAEIGSHLAEAGVRGVLSLLAAADADGPGPLLTPLLHLLQGLGDTGCEAPLWCLTSGAVEAGGAGQRTVDPAQAGVWGFGRTAALELPGRWGGLLDLPEAIDGTAWDQVCRALTSGAEDQVAVRSDGIHVRRLVPLPAADPAAPGTRVRGTVLITGGTGALGSRLARRQAEAGAEHLVLVSRAGERAPGAAALGEELRAAGCRVTFAACDVGDREAVAALLAAHPVDAVFHTAGTAHLTPLDRLTAAELDGVLRAKAEAALLLDELLGDRPLDAFVLFSSIAGVWGSGEQAGYAAANAVLDALAEARRARGLTATSVAWGPWAEAGMAVDGGVEDHLRKRGVRALRPAWAVQALEREMAEGRAATVVADVDWSLFHPAFTALRPSPLLDAVPAVGELRAAATAGTGRSPSGDDWARRVTGLGEAEAASVALELVRARAAEVLGHAGPGAVHPERPFRELGFDSLTAVELRDRLATATGLRLPATAVFDHPSPQALARRLTAMAAEATGTQRPGRADAAAAPLDPDEPVAIVAMACRYPGGTRSPEDLWRLVTDGTDVISPFPADRGWPLENLYDPDPDRRGTSYSREGGFLHEVADFDAEFFGISPREALAMDPQQRLLLETSWEAFERAGIAPGSLRGSRTGVFAGLNNQDYAAVLAASGEDVEGHLGTGNSASVVSGRLSYTYGFEGPSLTVDTACSSSLVALHLAVQSLRQGECDLALVGGVTVMSTPGIFVEFSRQRAMSRDGRCKSFAEAADGTGWSEGAGVLLVERLSDAVREGHRVLAVVRGSAVNQDGASNGLTAPNGPAQQRVIRQALANAGLAPAEVDAVEAHGTGTTLGDPIEAQALLATYGQDRPEDRPLWLGSVKSNIGHTQAAAGVAGIIKMVEAMRHGRLPRTLHVDAPSSHVDWTEGGVRLLTEEREWPRPEDRPRRAGVSSFGFSGTNAHVVLEQAPDQEPAGHQAPGPRPQEQAGPAAVLWPLSGHTEEAVQAQAARLLAHLDRPGTPGTAGTGAAGASAADIGFSLAVTRTALPHRAVLVGRDRAQLVERLTALAHGAPTPGVERALAEPGSKLALLFPGQGSQRPGAGRELARTQPVFAEALDEVCAHLDPALGRPLGELLFAEEGTAEAALLDRTAYTQAGLFALGTALFRLYESWGVRPDAVMGHSVGELTAAHIAGVLSLPDACALVAARGRLMGELPESGAMIAVEAAEAEVLAALDADPEAAGRVAVAAVNGPASTLLSGDEDAVTRLAGSLAGRGARTKRLRVSHAFHSPHMDPMLDAFRAVARGLTFHEPRLPVLSNLTGALAAPGQLTSPDYWVDHVRRTVRFADGVAAARAHGVTAFLELGPDAVLTAMAGHCLSTAPPAADAPGGQAAPPVLAAALRAGTDEPQQAATALARLHAHGRTVDWAAFQRSGRTRTVELPTYAFRPTRHWPSPARPRDLAPHDPSGQDARFWQAVEDEDLTGLTDTLAETLATVGDGTLADTVAPALPVLAAWRRARHDRAAGDSRRYTVAWRPVRQAALRGGAGAGAATWLLVTPAATSRAGAAADAEKALGRRLSADGARVLTLRLPAETLTDRAETAHRLRRLLDTTGGDGTRAATGVVSLLALADETPLTPALTLLQALGDAGVTAPLWCLTTGAVATDTQDAARLSPAQAQLWGLGRVAALEHGDRWGGLLDLPGTGTRPENALWDDVAAVLGGTEDQIAVRPGAVLARRLVHAPHAPRAARPGWTPRGTVLITGGTGALARHVARRLASSGAGHLVLAGRRGPRAPGADGLREELTELGARVTIAACDLTDRDAVTALLAEHPVDAVVHTAGAARLTRLDRLTAAELAETNAAKVTGADLLDELLADRPLDAFVLFSSIAGVWGSGDHGAYAAANAHLDALARRRRAHGRPATSVAWGPWAGSGMAVEGGVVEDLRRRGLTALEPESAVDALFDALASDEPCTTVAEVDWARFSRLFTAARPSPLLQEIVAGTGADTPGPDRSHPDGPEPAQAPDAATDLRRRLTAMPPQDRGPALVDLVRTTAAEVLGHGAGARVESRRGFLELGFDSLTTLEFRDRISARTGIPLPATAAFDHPTPAALAAHLESALLVDAGRGTALLAETDRLADALAALPADDEHRATLADRLRGIADRLQDTADPAPDGAAGTATGGEPDEEFADASVDDMLALIENEFRNS